MRLYFMSELIVYLDMCSTLRVLPTYEYNELKYVDVCVCVCIHTHTHP